MSNTLDLVVLGFTAGLALAIPLGPMGLALIHLAMSRGIKFGVTGAFALATIDGIYAAVTLALGSALLGFVTEWGQTLSFIGVGLLILLGILTSVKAINAVKSGDAVSEAELKTQGGLLTTFGVYAAATVINPPTVLYFLAITPSVAGISSGAPIASALIFGTATMAGSVSWGLTLAIGGSSIRSFTTPKVRNWLGVVAGALIIAFAIALLLRNLE